MVPSTANSASRPYPPSPIEFVHRIVWDLDLSNETRRQAEQLAERVVEAGIGIGCHSGGLAAGCLYAAARERCEQVTQVDLTECADVSAATIRARWEELRSLVEDRVG